MAPLFDQEPPPIEPCSRGMLDVGDGHLLYWEVCGNPSGIPVVVLHGGPGSGCSTEVRRFFDPEAYRIVLFDQRNSGRSMPHASQPDTDLSTNTTAHLLGDIEKLRAFLRVDRWVVFGGSWGATLAIAYAESWPHCVSALVLVGVTTTRPSEIEWLYRGVAPLVPAQWAKFRAGVPEGDQDGDLVAAYYGLLQSPDLSVREKAARDWCEWEFSLVSADSESKPESRRLTPEFQMAFARIVTHYFHHHAWLEDGILLRNAQALAGIPGAMVHGHLDLAAPLTTAWELSLAWPDGELVIVNAAGHSSHDPGMEEAVVAATNRFATKMAPTTAS